MIPEPLDNIIATFRAADEPLRMELLVDYANKLPALPAPLRTERDLGLNQLPECRTPVFLWVEAGPSGGIELHADAPPEAPTVRGLLSVLAHGCSGAAPERVEAVPVDLIDQLGLSGVIRVQRQIGFSVVLRRVRREVAEAVARDLAMRAPEWTRQAS